jgi:hypothetical protein
MSITPIAWPNRSFNRARRRRGFYRSSERTLGRSCLRLAGAPVNLVR